ncbi:MAG: hydrogenase maturation protease [Brevinematales bacterium]|nr:hydrogenase maturation protease [Brevinematales bacterium]
MKLAVVGVGHALGGDDFVGIKVVEELSEEIKNSNIEFITTMDPSRIISILEDYDFVVIVDAVFGEKAGDIVLIDYKNYPTSLKPISSHGFEVPLAIETAKKLGIDVDKKVRIIGITITEIVLYEDTLSKEVNLSVNEAKNVIKSIISNLNNKNYQNLTKNSN